MKLLLVLSFSTTGLFVLPESKEHFPHDFTSTVSEVDFRNGLFESNEVLDIKLSGDLRNLFNDRSDNASYHSITLSYSTKDSDYISIPARAKTRGNFRRTMGNCTYPPIWLDFSESNNLTNSIFSGYKRLKLVMPCQGDELVVREYLLYRIYNLITEKSFRARLVRIETEDTKRNKKTTSFYGMLLEEEQQMAARNHERLVKRSLLKMQSTEPDAFLKMAVFEYLIGNTDWSVEYQQNIRLLAKDSLSIPVTVPYDFDHAGLVDAPYARPAEELEMHSVKERRYRGYCVKDMKAFDGVITFFNGLKKDIYTLYTDFPLVNKKYLKFATDYFDEFYATINNPKKVLEEFGYPCLPGGTGNVIIKGLEKN
ncbi:MAG TPA: hypothetical protein VET23_14625 [Chitinophagaceae bacterium]|nr:hypothetical protein [Chitinophagaceae bacterium]